ncbi:phosphomannomutase CpsG [Alteromonadaceae bacterium M269]|nr:phosphomannomutase CpsG [Alteromonadaceae bacterium M269]
MQISCFKAYDIRGKLVEQLDENVAYRIGRAFAEYLSAKRVVVGGDVRLTSEPLKLALSAGLIDGGADVIDLGMTGTEEIYFATQHLGVDGGIEVTASHNPIDYNGMKLVKTGSQPISGDSGLFAIRDMAQAFDDDETLSQLQNWGNGSWNTNGFLTGASAVSKDKLEAHQQYSKQSCMVAYLEHLLTYVDANNFKPLKLVVNAGNGAAGPVIDEMESTLNQVGLPIEFVRVNHEPDGSFPNGIPNPLLVENRADTEQAVIEHKADMGIAWDGDFDRCFLFDERGDFVEGYYIVGLLAQAFLDKERGAKIIYDPRVFWNTEDIVSAAGGQPIMSKTGHAFIKERMRAENAAYGGEMSAHHYFRDFAYCDSGMIPWLLVAELICTKAKPLSELVSDRIQAYPSSGEINSLLDDPDAAIERILKQYESEAVSVDYTDGIGIDYGQWRFNLRKSNTEPVIRLNVESKADVALMQEKTTELLELIRA